MPRIVTSQSVGGSTTTSTSSSSSSTTGTPTTGFDAKSEIGALKSRISDILVDVSDLGSKAKFVINNATARTLAQPDDGTTMVTGGRTSLRDGGGGVWVWKADSTDSDDGALTLQITGVTTGRWKRLFDGPLNVKWFGATGDGVTNDTAAIQAAINSGAAAVYFPPGTYMVTHLDVLTGTTLLGNGWDDSIIKRINGTVQTWAYASANPALVELIYGNDVHNILIADLCVDGNSANQGIMTDPLLRLGTSAGAVNVDNIYVIANFTQNSGERGSVRIERVKSINSCTNSIVSNNHDMLIVRGCWIENAGKNGIYLAQTYGRNALIEGNYIRGCGYIYGGGIGCAQSGAIIRGNEIVDCYEYGVLLNSTGNGKRGISDIVVSGNNIRVVRRRVLDNSGSLTAFTDSQIGIGISWQYPAPGIKRTSRRCNVTITGNTIQGCLNTTTTNVGIGIAIQGAAAATYRPAGFSVVGNTIMLTNGSGIDIRYVDDCTVTGNVIRSPGFACIHMLDVKFSSIVGNAMNRKWDVADRVLYSGKTYECIRRHYSVVAEPPTVATSDWTEVDATDDGIDEEWESARAYAPAGVSSNTPTCFISFKRVNGASVTGIDGTNVVADNTWSGVDGPSHICSTSALLPVLVALPAVPTENCWPLGARIHNTNTAAGQPTGWICTTSGWSVSNWTASNVYDVGQVVKNGVNIYRCSQSGTAAGSGGPTGTGTAIVDNTVRWDFLTTLVATWTPIGVPTQGATLASAATIVPTSDIHVVSGTTTIDNITPLDSAIPKTITLIPSGAWSTSTSGNIGNVVTATANVPVIATWVPTTSKWYLR